MIDAIWSVDRTNKMMLLLNCVISADDAMLRNVFRVSYTFLAVFGNAVLSLSFNTHARIWTLRALLAWTTNAV